MSRRIPIFAALLGVFTLVAAPIALAGAGMRHGPPSPEQMAEHAHAMADHLMDDIGVDETQSTTIHALVDEAVGEMTAIHDDGRALRQATQEALAAGDDEGLDVLEGQVAALADRAARTAFSHVRDLRAALTDAQWAELSDKHQRFKRHGPPWLHRGPGPDGPEHGERRPRGED